MFPFKKENQRFYKVPKLKVIICKTMCSRKLQMITQFYLQM